MKNGLIFLLLALLLLEAAGHDRSPRALIQATPAKVVLSTGVSIAAGTWQTCEPSRVPPFLVHSHAKGTV